MQFAEAKEFLDKLEDLVKFLIPHYIDEGKTKLVCGDIRNKTDEIAW